MTAVRNGTAQNGSPADLIDLGRYPVTDLDSRQGRALVATLRASLAERGVAILDGFLRKAAVEGIARETETLLRKAHREDVWGSPYLELPDQSYPEGHPRRAAVRSATWVLAYDLIPGDSRLRALYEWDPLMVFFGEVLERRPLYRFGDPLGALNLAVMPEGDVQGWHFDSTDFVISLAIRASERGGNFECASRIRSADDENYEEVGRVLRGERPERVEILPMVPGTLMIFVGRNALHRVSPVQGDVARHVALLAYDTKPGTDSSDLLKLVRYGRTEPVTAHA
jgi:hypothetical protein